MLPSDLIKVTPDTGRDLDPEAVLEGYHRGIFPMPTGPSGSPMAWWSPDPRGVIPLGGMRITRSLRLACRRFTLRIDTAFDEVLAACADPRRNGYWIDDQMQRVYLNLHRAGYAHSVEAWTDTPQPKLAGGLYGVAVGGLFAGESMFHRQTDASKVALVGLVAALATDDATGRLLDVQWMTAHLASLGAIEVSRAEYLRRLAVAVKLPSPFVPGDQSSVDCSVPIPRRTR
jgi:leucyl/phenylalanyl-tRNA---protein transferase